MDRQKKMIFGFLIFDFQIVRIIKAILPEVLFPELSKFVHHLLVFLWLAERLYSLLVDLPN